MAGKERRGFREKPGVRDLNLFGTGEGQQPLDEKPDIDNPDRLNVLLEAMRSEEKSGKRGRAKRRKRWT